MQTLPQFTTSDDADQPTITTQDRVKMLAAWHVRAFRDATKCIDIEVLRQGDDVRPHDFGNCQHLQRIDAVFPGHVIPTATNLLGEDGPLHCKDRRSIGDDRRDHQRQHHVDIPRQLESEQQRGERNAHGPPENRAHPDEGPESRSVVRKDTSFKRAEGGTHHQHRRENAAGRSGS